MEYRESQLREQERAHEQREEPERSHGGANWEVVDLRTITQGMVAPTPAEASGDFSREREHALATLEQTRAVYAGVAEHERSTARRDYVSAKKRYAEVLVSEKKYALRAAGLSEESVKQQLAAYIRTEIFDQLVIGEEQKLAEQRAAALPEEKRGLLRRMYDGWSQLTPVKKGLITTAIATGTAFAATAMGREGMAAVELTGVALFFSKSFLTGLGVDLMTGFVGLGIHSAFQKKIESDFHAQVERERQRTFVQSLEFTSHKYRDLLQRKGNAENVSVVATALTMLATGRACGIGLDLLSNTSALRAVSQSTTAALQSGPDIMGKVNDVETIGKPFKSFFKRILDTVKRSND